MFARLTKRIRGELLFPSPLTPRWADYLRQRPLVFTAWFHLRRLVLTLLRGTAAHQSVDVHIVRNVAPYSLGKLGTVYRERTERLMNVFRSIRGLDLKAQRVLVLGPRNEAEVLLLGLYGFDRRRMTAIDLFSYSPLIQVMDMQRLEFDDDTFDVVYAAYTITYSDKVGDVCAEILRVVRDGGLVALAFQHFVGERRDSFGHQPLLGGLPELFGYFAGHVKHVYWQEAFGTGDSELCSTVFSVSKGR